MRCCPTLGTSRTCHRGPNESAPGRSLSRPRWLFGIWPSQVPRGPPWTLDPPCFAMARPRAKVVAARRTFQFSAE
eukprot:3947308-Pyramimonas_sp.AAC.1